MVGYSGKCCIRTKDLQERFMCLVSFIIHKLEIVIVLSRNSIISYLFGSIVVNLSCKNSYYYTVQE